MVNKIVDAYLMKAAFLAGTKRLEANKEWINELNVFPVPDGDTGTNMSLTMLAAAKEVAAITEPTIASLAKAMSSGSLRGARGNSGVILSQLFRGFAREVESAEMVTTQVLADAFSRAVETAYKAVMKPKEGTILTVARGMAEKAQELAPQLEDVLIFADQVVAHGEEVLRQTPEMLPVLKQAGVVDSGGQGLIEVMKGVLEGLSGKEISLDIKPLASPSPVLKRDAIATADIRFGYCTEFIINLEQEDEQTELELKQYLESIGDSIVVVADQEIVKVHVHTNDPGLAIQKALTYGSLSRMKIDNMREEHEEHILKELNAAQATQPEPMIRKKYGFIAISVGTGMGEILTGLGADYLIEGGQTMNPSTEDMLLAINQIPADHIFILPNNKNIILAAQQAKELIEDKNIIVVPSKTVPQGIAAMINFIPDLSPEENLETMVKEMDHVKTIQMTYAVRDTMIDGQEITQGDIMAIGDEGLLAVGKMLMDTTLSAVQLLADPAAELITVYYGDDVELAEAQQLAARIEELCPNCEVELHHGGQPIYYYLISVE